MQDTVLLAHNLHLFLDIPEVIQAIHNGIPRSPCPCQASRSSLQCSRSWQRG
jgi:hypothetical protein